MPLFLAFLLVPLIEIALFIQVGGVIGLWPTLGIVIATAVLGSWLVRSQGLMAMGRLRQSFAELDDPTEPLAHGAMILIAGVLLLTPGFFTDALGFSLLVPAVRAAVFRYLRSRVTVARFQMGPDLGRGAAGFQSGPTAGFGQGDVIDGDFEEVRDPTDQPTRRRPGSGSRQSGWVTGPDGH